MDILQVNKWIEDFKNLWINHKIAEVVEMFNEVEEYFEGPFSAPVSSKDDVTSLWLDIEFQDIEKLDIDVIAIDGNKCVLHWYFKYKDTRNSEIYEMDGVYEIHFNNNCKCQYFKQWWVMAY